jgi:hypothetical protein
MRCRGNFDVSWFKRYLVSCLIALFIFSGIEGYLRPSSDMRVGAVVISAAVWPVFVAFIAGGTVGEVVRDIRQGKLG